MLKNGKDAAYINDSFKGILRLSPNSSNTFNTSSINIGTKHTAFQDSIKDVLKKQYISVSTSDGIILDMRISDEGAEYNNLNILGNLYSKKIELYAKNFIFNLGNKTKMPLHINSLVDASLSTSEEYEYTEIDDKNVDSSYILINESLDKRDFVFKNAGEVIDSFISKKLLQVNIVPTGSIHFVPISPSNYRSLKGSYNHNTSNTKIDTLIRDFLPCDGSEYKAADFPELAKILYNTNITYWDKDGNRLTYKNGSKSGYFRVPDLRCQFIRSINQMSISDAKNDEVGIWEVDSTIDMATALRLAESRGDTHYHYITLDSFTGNSKLPPTENLFKYNSQEGVTNGTAAPMARLGNIYARALTGVACSWGNCNDHGFTRPYGTDPITKGGYSWSSGNGASGWCTALNTSYGPTCGYILSTAPKYNCSSRKLIDNTSWVGLSGGAIPMETSDVTWDKLNYTKWRKDSLETSEKKFRESSSLHGYENTPEFYGMMAFIKI